MQHPHLTGTLLPEHLGHTFPGSRAQSTVGLASTRTTEPIYLIPLFCLSDQLEPVNEFMRTLLSSTEVIFTRPPFWIEPSIASARLNCSTEGATESLCRRGDLLDRCYGRDDLQIRRAERET